MKRTDNTRSGFPVQTDFVVQRPQPKQTASKTGVGAGKYGANTFGEDPYVPP